MTDLFVQGAILLTISILIGLSQTAGIGGGPLINICLMLLYDSQTSISLTYLFIFGGSLASIWRSIQKEQSSGKQLINLNLIMITLPLMNSGAMLGIIVRNYLSELCLTMLFVFLFVFLIWDIIRCIKKQKKQQKKPEADFQRPHPFTQLATTQRPNPNMSQNQLQSDSISTSALKKQKKIHFLILFFSYYLCCVIVSVVKGGIGYESVFGMQRCSAVGLVIVVGFVGVSVILAWVFGNQIGQEEHHIQVVVGDRGNCNMAETQRQFLFRKQNIVMYIIAGLAAGIIGSALGMGGGPILIPLWLTTQIPPTTASNSTSPLILSSSLISLTLSSLNSNYTPIPTQILLLYTFLSFISSAIIKDILTRIAQKYQLKNMLLYLLLAIMMLGLAVFLPVQIRKMGDWEGFVRFGEVC